MAEGSRSVQKRIWWGEYTIAHGQSGRWRIGPLTLTISRFDNEGRICRASSGNSSDTALSVEVPCANVGEPEPGAETTRYGTTDRHETIELTPIMPDRSVVTRPEEPVIVPAHEAVTVYVGSPLWLRVRAGVPGRELGEFPAFQPRLTWWGPNTMEGETCYATRTYGRLRLDELRPGPHRVMTAVSIVNRASRSLLIERLNLPVKTLSIYAAGRSSKLWTETVTLERAAGEEFAELSVGDDPGPDVKKAELVSPPREAPTARLFRAFGKLFR